jgi:vancomycin resistance protein VanJ
MQRRQTKGGSLRRWLRMSLGVLAVAYPAGLVCLIVALRFVGDAWWATSVALYLPRVAFALPLPLIVIALAVTRRARLLGLQVISLWLVLFPLLGLTLSWRSYPADGEATFRVLTYNVNSGSGGFRALADQIFAHSPDLVFLQELPHWRAEEMKAQLAANFPHIVADDQFLLASKFRVVSMEAPPRIPFYGQNRSPRFMRYVVETPLGPITVYNLHTVSPRGAFYRLRGQGLRREILSGRLFTGEAAPEILGTAALRMLQVKAMAEMARREQGPVLIVGDSNLPTLSAARARNLADFHDGFAEAGLGFGFSYPTKLPWMRIDLLLSNDQLAFKRVEVGCGRASDHLCVFGDVVARAH